METDKMEGWSEFSKEFDDASGPELGDEWPDLDDEPDDDASVVGSRSEIPAEAVINFEITPLQVRLGLMASKLAAFFLSHHRVPFFSLIGMFWARRAFWFSGGDIPVYSPSSDRDLSYFESRGRRS